jgi:hypothetical protein
MLREIMDRANQALRRLSGAGDDHGQAAEAERELVETHIPALECEDAVMAAATRATMRWMLKERRLRRLATESRLSVAGA